MSVVQPISQAQQQQVVAATADCIQRAAELLGREFSIIPVYFNLRGRAAGMYRVKQAQREIRYNPYLFAKYFADNLMNTVPHEVAHYAIDCCYGLRKVRPHGKEWQQLMVALGVEPSVTCRYDLSGVPQRRQQRFDYRCDCRTHQLTTIRHNKVQRGVGSYLCKACRQPLRWAVS